MGRQNSIRAKMALLADLLTVVRLPLGLAVVYAGASGGEAALPQVVWISLVAWTADSVDGHLKRTSEARPGWIGRHDFTFDVFYSACIALSLTLAGYVSAWLFSLWFGLLGSLAVIGRSRSGIIVTEGVAILALLVRAMQSALALGGAMLGWGVVTLALDRKRFAYRFASFKGGLRSLWQRNKDGKSDGPEGPCL
jgi:phosphatidylglycerophosphate synthase